MIFPQEIIKREGITDIISTTAPSPYGMIMTTTTTTTTMMMMMIMIIIIIIIIIIIMMMIMMMMMIIIIIIIIIIKKTRGVGFHPRSTQSTFFSVTFQSNFC